jgi:CheY-like chemotaxis protein
MQQIYNNITVVLADDHEIVREGFALICEESGLRILGQCADGVAAVDMVMTLKPTLAILDLEMPKLSGIDVIRQLKARGSGSKLLILSISREDQRVMEALRAGADAYILKDGPKRHLMPLVLCETEEFTFHPCCGAWAFLRALRTPLRKIPWRCSARANWRFSPTWSMACGQRISRTFCKSVRKPWIPTEPA